MTAHALAANAYTTTARSVGTPRAIEYQAFQRVTAMLAAAKEPDAPFARMAEAVHMNSRLWSALAADLASPRNQLPIELRGQLFGLAEFSRKRGLELLGSASVSPEALEDLVAINTAIMRGLRGDASASEPAGSALSVGA